MTIVVACSQCQRKINAPDQFAGKRVRCPGCQAVVEVPAVGQDAGATHPPATASSTAASADPAATLFVRLSDGRQVGPITQQALVEAVQQGQVNAACQIWQQGWPQPRWAGELFPALAQQAAVPPAAMGYPSAPPQGYPSAMGYPAATPPGYGFDPLTGGYAAAPQGALHSPPAMLGIPQVPWGSMQASSEEKPKKKVRRDGPFGRPSDARGFAIAISTCAFFVLQEVAMFGVALYALSQQDPDEGRIRFGFPCLRWILIGSAIGGILKRKKESRWFAVGLLLLAGLTCGPLMIIGAMFTGLAPATVLGVVTVLDLVFAAALSFSPSATIYFTEEN